MYQGKFVLSQLMECIYWYEFDKCVQRYHGDKKVKNLSCFDQFLAMVFGQLANIDSLRGIVVCLQAHKEKIYHLGFSNKISKSTLADANEKRDWRIYRDLALILIQRAKRLYSKDKPVDLDLKNACYVVDATVIELCLSIFPWAKLKNLRAAVKMNLQMNLTGNIPSFFTIVNAREPDVKFLDSMEFEMGAFYIFDRGYFDSKRLYQIHLAGAFFVIRAKKNLSIRRIYSNELTREDKENGLRCDQILKFAGKDTSKNYPQRLRRIKFFNKNDGHYYVVFTNDFNCKAQTIATLYKYRWQIELFFKWIKQHLKIKSFWGRSANAVKIQICIALCTFLIVAIVKKMLKIDRDIYEILQILNVSLLDKKPLKELISETGPQSFVDQSQKQACLLDI